MNPLESQVGGDHYAKLGKYQPAIYLKHVLTPEEYRGWVKGNAIVYLSRQKQNTEEDMLKAKHTLEIYEELNK